MRLNGDRDHGSVGGVAADQLHAVTIRQREQPPAKPIQPILVGLGQGQRQHGPGRSRAHRRQIAEIHRQRLVTETFRVGGGKKMHVRHQGIHRHHQLLVSRRNQQRAVVADAQRHVGTAQAMGGEITVDQGKFGNGHQWHEARNVITDAANPAGRWKWSR